MGRRTTPPPPNRELLAAFTIEVVASLVIDPRTSEILELHNEDGAGREPVGLAGWSCPSLYRLAMVGIEDSWTGSDILCWGRAVCLSLTRRYSVGDVLCSAALPIAACNF